MKNKVGRRVGEGGRGKVAPLLCEGEVGGTMEERGLVVGVGSKGDLWYTALHCTALHCTALHCNSKLQKIA